MNAKEIEKKLKTIDKNEIAKCTSKEELRALFSKNGIDFSDKEWDLMSAELEKASTGKNAGLSAELSEDALENVNGGIAGATIALIVGLVIQVGSTVGTTVFQSIKAGEQKKEQEEEEAKRNGLQRTGNTSTTGGTNGSANLL